MSDIPHTITRDRIQNGRNYLHSIVKIHRNNLLISYSTCSNIQIGSLLHQFCYIFRQGVIVTVSVTNTHTNHARIISTDNIVTTFISEIFNVRYSNEVWKNLKCFLGVF